MGSVPAWYTTIQAARYLGVAPWELLEQPLFWQETALASQRAESSAAKQRDKAKGSG
jgi:hypothetical protein